MASIYLLPITHKLHLTSYRMQSRVDNLEKNMGEDDYFIAKQMYKLIHVVETQHSSKSVL